MSDVYGSLVTLLLLLGQGKESIVSFLFILDFIKYYYAKCSQSELTWLLESNCQLVALSLVSFPSL